MRLLRSEEQSALPDASPLDQERIFEARAAIAAMTVSPNIDRYIVALVMATREPGRYGNSPLQQWIRVGSSPRASIALDRCARASAWLAGRDYVDPEDVRAVAHAVLRHRMLLSYDALADNVDSDTVIDELLTQVAVA